MFDGQRCRRRREDIVSRKSNNPKGRPAAPRLNVIDPSEFVKSLSVHGLRPALLAQVIGISVPTLRALIEGNAANTFKNRVVFARLLSIAGVERVTSEELPVLDLGTKIGDLRALHKLTVNAFQRRWIEHLVAGGPLSRNVDREQLAALLLAFARGLDRAVDAEHVQTVSS